jgi:hypothetical protein
MKTRTILGAAIGTLLSLATVGASAQSLVASNTNATINTLAHVTTVVFTNTSPVTYGAFDFRMTYNPANLTTTPAAITTSDPGTACNVTAPGTILCFANPSGVNTHLNPTVTITIPFDIGATAAVEPLSLFDVNGFDHTGSPLPLSGTNGSVTIVTGPPPDVVVTFNPISGSTVAFGGGMPGANVTQSIAIGNTGTIGTGTVSGCVISGPDAASFSITGGNPSTVPPATSLGLQATLGAAALNATLTCNVADSSATTSATWTLTAPAGTVLLAPTLAANPASGTTITLPGSYGAPVSSNIVITPTGGDAGGPDANVACSASAGFTVTAATLTFTPPGGAAQNAVVGCTPGAAAVAGTVSCGGTDQAGVINWSWPVNCPAAQTAPPPPTFVPASSLWSKLALFGVFAALGMLVLGLRRNH